jgi:hypothetical protein
MFRALAGCAAAAAAASAVLAMTAAPALADARTAPDGTGDVWSLMDGTQLGERVNVDLVQTRFTHDAHRISVKASYTDLVRNTDTIEFAMLMKRPDGKKFVAVFMAGADDRNGAVQLQRYNGNQVKCAGRSKSIDYAGNEVSISIPRSCVGKPRWIKYEAAAVAFDQAGGDAYIDDAGSDGAEPSAWSGRLAKG